MEKQLLEIQSEYLRIHTGMNSRAFSQSHLFDSIHENGWIAMYSDTIGWSFNPYQFTDIQSLHNNNYHEEIVINGPSFYGVSLQTLIEETKATPKDFSKFDKLIETLEKLNSAIEASLLHDEISILPNGPLNIIVSKENNFLFLPTTIFQKAINTLSSEDHAKKYECYLNQSLNNIVSEWRFSFSCIIYFTFSGLLPFTELNIEKRAEDYYDKNYIPLEILLQLSEKDERALQIINTNLSQQALIENKTARKKNSKKPISESHPFLPGDIKTLATLYKKQKLAEIHKNTDIQEFQKYVHSQKMFIKRKRFLRHHKTAIIVTLFMLFCAVNITKSIIKENNLKPTTKDMSAVQVVKTFYDGLNSINSDILESTGTTKALKRFSDTLSAIFVTQKMRIGYENVAPFFTPQQWLNSTNPINSVIYGISHLKITPLELPVTENKTTDLNNNVFYIANIGDTAKFNATYYLIKSNANHEYTVVFKNETLYLEYLKKNYWQITKIETNHETKIPIDNVLLESNLKIAYEQASQKNRGYEMAKKLAEIYPWIPDPKTVAAAKKEELQSAGSDAQ